MYKKYIVAACFFLLAACKKNDTPAALPEGSVSFQYTAKDTIQVPVSIQKDSALPIGLQAALAGNQAGSDHWVTFAVDTTQLSTFQAKYGEAMLLPASSYLFYKATTPIPAGARVSDTAWLNIGQQTKLMEYSSYVLPVVIQSVDGSSEGVANKVLYYVFKTGKPLFINKKGWTIDSYSSQNGTSSPNFLLDDDNLSTFWASNISGQMPQWVVINFNREVTFSSLNYYLPTALRYPTLGGYPTSVRIETSMDGTSWTDKGTFAGNVKDNMQNIPIGETTARYLRFTSLTSVKYSNAFEAVFISGIGLMP